MKILRKILLEWPRITPSSEYASNISSHEMFRQRDWGNVECANRKHSQNSASCNIVVKASVFVARVNLTFAEKMAQSFYFFCQVISSDQNRSNFSDPGYHATGCRDEVGMVHNRTTAKMNPKIKIDGDKGNYQKTKLTSKLLYSPSRG